ncbi:hypothetical protein QYF36_013846 [Acer negundo]|nr:hypothetical protein QYF36_013846 [Acer negundo]
MGVVEVFSSGNSVSKEEMVRETIEVVKNSAVGLTEITSAVKERTGTRQGLRQTIEANQRLLCLVGCLVLVMSGCPGLVLYWLFCF